jgi:hypothetical protein
VQQVRPLQKFRSANSSDTAFTAPTVEYDMHLLAYSTYTGAAAATRRVLPLATAGVSVGGNIPVGIELYPYGLGSDNDVFNLRLIGWRRITPPTSSHRTLYLPTIIAGLTCTISAFVGDASGPVLNTERFADTITVTSAMEATITAATTRGGRIWTYSPVNDTPGRAVIYFDAGFEFLELTGDPTTGTPTMNALYSLLDEIW